MTPSGIKKVSFGQAYSRQPFQAGNVKLIHCGNPALRRASVKAENFKLTNHIKHGLCQCLSFVSRIALGINPNDRLRIGLSNMNPVLPK